MQECDTLLMVGTSFPYSEFLPPEGQARGVQIDIDGRMLSLRYPMEVPLVGDSRESLRALIPLLQRKTDRGWREEVEAGVRKWWKVVEGQALIEAKPINPQRMFSELSPKLPDKVHPRGGLGLGGQLVRARPEGPQGDDGVPLGQPRHHGVRGAVCHWRQVRLPRAAGHRLRGGWGHADEWQQRAASPSPSTGRSGTTRA